MKHLTSSHTAHTTSQLGKPVYRFESCESTNTIAMQLAKDAAPHGTLVVSHHQTKGRGRGQHSWVTDQGSLAISVILEPHIPINQAGRLTMLAAYAVASTYQAFTDQSIGIKWPNDILICGKKVSGILIETIIQEQSIEKAIVGIGLNLTRPSEELNCYAQVPHLGFLSDVSTTPIEEAAVLDLLMQHLEKGLKWLTASPEDPLLNFVTSHSITLHTQVSVLQNNRTLTGYATTIYPDGSLGITGDNGSHVRIVAGELVSTGENS